MGYNAYKKMGDIAKEKYSLDKVVSEPFKFDVIRVWEKEADKKKKEPSFKPVSELEDRFLESGRAKDAFDVYYCYLEMFVGSYGKTRKMIETLCEFESNASSLLMKHRDHFSHSVYVFSIGLAFYDESEAFRKAYKTKYEKFFRTGKKLFWRHYRFCSLRNI